MAAEPLAVRLAAWYVEHFPPPPEPAPTAPRPAAQLLALSDGELLEKARSARNGDAFTRLWSGDCSRYAGDHSRADAALVAYLLWWTGNDPARTDALFRRSGLMRSKWDERRGGRTYGRALLDHVGSLSGGGYGERRP